MRTRILFCLVLSAVASSGCSSPVKRATELMEKGLYSDAVSAFEAILAKDPTDEKAIEGLKVARMGWLDRKLIEVRKTREGGNPTTAGESLMEVLAKEKAWMIQAPGNATFTQEEEESYFVEFSTSWLKKSLADKKPLRAEYHLVHFDPLLNGKLSALRREVKALGKKTCEELSEHTQKDEAFYLGFVNRFCHYFDAKPKKALPVLHNLGPEFFGGVNLDGKIKGFSESQDAELEEAALDTLQRSGWFEPNVTKKLKIQLSGSYNEIHTQQPIDQRAIYFIDEPYTEMVRVEKTRTVPRTEMGPNRIEVTRYQNETYSALEPKTSYRKVERVFTYNAIHHEQRLSLNLKSTWDPSGLSLVIPQTDRFDIDGIEHHENQPHIGLKPQMPSLVQPVDWIKLNRAAWQAKSSLALANAWRTQFCADTQNANRVLKCVRQELPEYPASVESWFDLNLGLPSRQALSLISRR